MKADLHVHTDYSFDGLSSFSEVVDEAVKKGLDCICITDHNQIEGALRAREYAKDILIIPGIEILPLSGDILGINVDKIIPDGLSARETVRRIKESGDLAVIPHPFDWPIENFVGDVLVAEALEVFNSSVVVKKSNNKALAFTKKNNLLITAGSDAHLAEFVGRGYLETSEDFDSAEELIKKIRKGKVKAKGAPMSIWEILRNSRSSMNAKRLKDYYWTVKLKRW